MNRKKGIGLILAVFFIVITAFIAVIAFSILSAGSTGGLTNIMSTRAYGIAYGGMEWYLEQLQNDTDWTNEVNQTGIALGSGTFNITINSASGTEVSFTVTGSVTGYENQDMQRQMSITANKLPQAALFALWWGRDTGSNLQLSGTFVTGDYWSRGNTTFTGGSSITGGIAYRPDNRVITGIPGGGTAVNSPYPEMPVILTTYYDNIISSANTLINAASSAPDRTWTSGQVLNGNTIYCNNLYTNGTFTISGHGNIVAYSQIELLNDPGDSGTLTINPSGGDINIYAGTNLYINSSQTDTHIRINSGTNSKVVLYSRSRSGTDQYTQIRRDAQIDGALIIGNRRIVVQQDASITDSTLYVNYQASTTNNYLQITNNAIVGTTSNPCNVISLSHLGSPSTNGLEISAHANVTGFIYHYGGTTGRAYFVNDAVMTGTVIISQFRNDLISNSTFTYNSSFTPPVGFEGYIVKEIESWDDQ